MSTFFNTTQPQTATNNAGLFGNASNQLNFQGVGLNNQQGAQNLLLNNVQQPTVLDSRSTVRQLTTLVPEWKGHFDLADHLMTSQEQTLVNVSMLVSQLQNIYENLLSTFDYSKASLNDINLQQDKLNNDLSDRLKYQDLQNLVTIKSRRLCEVIISNQPSTDVSSAFRIPNHINVQVSKELYERVRNLKSEIDYIQNEVQLLKEIDVFQAPTFIESVLNSHDSRITNLGDSLTNLLKRAESVLNKDLKREVWSGLTVDSSTLRKNFLDAIGLETTKPDSESMPVTEVKKQINYLKKFNSSYNDHNFQYMRDYGYNIKDLLVNTVPNQSLMMPTPGFQTGGLNPVTGAPNLFGQALNQSQQFGSGTGFGTSGSGFFGSSTGLGTGFGSTSTGFGTTSGTPGFGTSGSGFFGSTATPGPTPFSSSANLLQSSTGSCANLYAQQFQKQQPVGGTGFGLTSGFGTTAGTTGTGFGTTTGLGTTGTPGFGSTQSPFGVGTTTATGTGLGTGFGTTTTGTPGFGSTTTSGTGLFGSTTGTTGLGTGFGSTTGTGFGSTSTGFGTTSGTTGTSTGLFGTGTTGTSGLGTGFGSTTTQPSTGLFGSSTTGTGTGFGSTTTSGTGFGFGSSSNLTGLGTSQNQSSNLFGHSSTGTASSANLLGSGTTSTGLFGNTGTGTSSGLFGSTTGTSGLGSGFGSSTTSTPFGTTTTGTGFGSTSTGFGTTSGTTGTSTGLFGSQQTSGFGSTTTGTGTSLFGSNTGSGTTGTGFGTTTGTGSSLFGATSTPGTGFGSSGNLSGLGGSSSNLFGSSTSSTSLFGNTTQTKPPGTELALYTNPTPGLTLSRS